MSKSKGNVYYPSELLAKGFSGSQLRFVLIYSPYRKKLNFTLDTFVQTTQKLNFFKNMVYELQNTKTFHQTEMQEGSISKITSDFESYMNNDLDVKSAFDYLTETIIKLHLIRTSLSSKDIKNLLNALKKVDGVLQCIF
jgi:cysteinyl-tRNA synthetase